MLVKSFIGVFGWANVLMPPLAYRPYVLFFALALGGAALGLWRRRLDRRLAAVLAIAILGALAVVVRINLQFTQPQGRYLLPGLPAFAVLIALGLRIAAAARSRASSRPSWSASRCSPATSTRSARWCCRPTIPRRSARSPRASA